MLVDWIHWLSHLSWLEVALLLMGTMLVDCPRYALARVVMVTLDFSKDLWRWLCGEGDK